MAHMSSSVEDLRGPTPQFRTTLDDSQARHLCGPGTRGHGKAV